MIREIHVWGGGTFVRGGTLMLHVCIIIWEWDACLKMFTKIYGKYLPPPPRGTREAMGVRVVPEASREGRLKKA